MDLLLREYELVSKWRKRSSNYRCNLKNIDEASEAIRGDLKSIAADSQCYIWSGDIIIVTEKKIREWWKEW